ncbi:ASCH domain-containing protein [Nannocystis pusilla]|uniref:ASCH domain-containing protein n=1 Tax=Nannocystis pusilla TaxID=889268 RepID=A0A9X3IXK5_9BACT|nr:ASCH domain-containing protein [Nannocystis pusilla]MCY1008547.1 ASCH domain-containing protein [Nannocystis pusilla]
MASDQRYPLTTPPKMRALSIRQPWLWAILEGDKRVENRDWAGCEYRGPVLLHASKSCGKREFEDAVEAVEEMRIDLGLAPIEVPQLGQLERGCICGIARVTGATRHPESWPNARWVVQSGYRIAGALGLELEDVRKLPPIPFKGALGFFPVGHDQLATVAGFETADLYRDAWRELEAASRRAA